MPMPTQEIPAAIARPKPTVKPAMSSPAPMLASPVLAPGAEPKSPIAEIDAKIAAGETDVALDLARSAKEDGTPASAAAWARAAMSAGNPTEAHQACVAWIARHPDKSAAEPRMFDARALRAAGRFDEARARLDEVLKAHPDHAEAKGMLKDLELMHPSKPSGVRHLKKKKPTQKLLG
jgi:predicted Zn-dependent protease